MTGSEAFFVARTMQAIELLCFQSASAPYVADVLQIHPRTARRLLNRLTTEGWLLRSKGQRHIYRPTLRLVALAAQLTERDTLAGAARPVVTRLHRETSAVAHLAVPSYRDVLCLVHRGGGPDARPQMRELIPAHATASGKVLLAFRETWRESVLERPLKALTERTVVDPEDLRACAAEISVQGFATEEDEYEHGVAGLAVPVQVGEDVQASLGLTWTGGRRPDRHLVGMLRDGAGEIAKSVAEATE